MFYVTQEEMMVLRFETQQNVKRSTNLRKEKDNLEYFP